MSPAVLALPDHKSRKANAYIYALQFSDGQIKVGVTWNPRGRAAQIAADTRGQIVDAAAFEYHYQWRTRAEADVLCRLRIIGNQSRRGGEWFEGLHFGTVCTLIEQISRRKAAAPGKPFSQTKEGRRMAAEAKRKRAEAKASAVFSHLLADLVGASRGTEPSQADA